MGVALNVEEDQLKVTIPGVCVAFHLVRRRFSGEREETEKTLYVLLSFNVVSLPDKVKEV
jgi:hypothetical protein